MRLWHVDLIEFLPKLQFDGQLRELVSIMRDVRDMCMANLYEKHVFGVGNSRITDEEWETLLRGYKELTGEDYVI